MKLLMDLSAPSSLSAYTRLRFLSVFPPGFRFYLVNEELLMYYLKRKICQRRIFLDAIVESDVYKWELKDFPVLVIAAIESVQKSVAIKEGYSDDLQGVIPISTMWILPQNLIGGIAVALYSIGITYQNFLEACQV